MYVRGRSHSHGRCRCSGCGCCASWCLRKKQVTIVLQKVFSFGVISISMNKSLGDGRRKSSAGHQYLMKMDCQPSTKSVLYIHVGNHVVCDLKEPSFANNQSFVHNKCFKAKTKQLFVPVFVS